MNKWLAILFIYIASVFYTVASFYHLSFGTKWTFTRAYIIALIFVGIEYIFSVLGNKWANEFITVFDIMILIIVFDLINLYIINFFILKNRVQPLKHGISLVLVGIAIILSADIINDVSRQKVEQIH